MEQTYKVKLRDGTIAKITVTIDGSINVIYENDFPYGHYLNVFADEKGITRAIKLVKQAGFNGLCVLDTWENLEPQKDTYALERLENAYQQCEQLGLHMYFSPRYNNFHSKKPLVPQYLRAREYDFGGTANVLSSRPGWQLARWNARVMDRLIYLYQAVGKEFDGRKFFGGVKTVETAIPVAQTYQQISSFKTHYLRLIDSLVSSFSHSPYMRISANYLVGSSLAEELDFFGHLCELALKHDFILGGPDLKIDHKGMSKRLYYIIRENLHNGLKTSFDHQWSGYTHINPNTGKPQTPEEAINYAGGVLGARWMGWDYRKEYWDGVVRAVKSWRDRKGSF